MSSCRSRVHPAQPRRKRSQRARRRRRPKKASRARVIRRTRRKRRSNGRSACRKRQSCRRRKRNERRRKSAGPRLVWPRRPREHVSLTGQCLKTLKVCSEIWMLSCLWFCKRCQCEDLICYPIRWREGGRVEKQERQDSWGSQGFWIPGTCASGS